MARIHRPLDPTDARGLGGPAVQPTRPVAGWMTSGVPG